MQGAIRLVLVLVQRAVCGDDDDDDDENDDDNAGDGDGDTQNAKRETPGHVSRQRDPRRGSLEPVMVAAAISLTHVLTASTTNTLHCCLFGGLPTHTHSHLNHPPTHSTPSNSTALPHPFSSRPSPSTPYSLNHVCRVASRRRG